jgi:glycosyltransferase involved in cell wall biosynthesis
VLKAQAASLGLADRIDWRGAQSHEAVRAVLTEADLFALASRTDRDGDRDGLPNVLLEAAASALPIAATRTAAIAELVADGANGILVDEGDANAMAAAIARLSRDPALRARLAAAAHETVLARFSPEPGYDRIAALLRAAVPHKESHAHRILRAHEAA